MDCVWGESSSSEVSPLTWSWGSEYRRQGNPGPDEPVTQRKYHHDLHTGEDKAQHSPPQGMKLLSHPRQVLTISASAPPSTAPSLTVLESCFFHGARAYHFPVSCPHPPKAPSFVSLPPLLCWSSLSLHLCLGSVPKTAHNSRGRDPECLAHSQKRSTGPHVGGNCHEKVVFSFQPASQQETDR